MVEAKWASSEGNMEKECEDALGQIRKIRCCIFFLNSGLDNIGWL